MYVYVYVYVYVFVCMYTRENVVQGSLFIAYIYRYETMFVENWDIPTEERERDDSKISIIIITRREREMNDRKESCEGYPSQRFPAYSM